MLVEVELADGKIAAGLFAHRALSDSVGYSIAAFARCLASGNFLRVSLPNPVLAAMLLVAPEHQS